MAARVDVADVARVDLADGLRATAGDVVVAAGDAHVAAAVLEQPLELPEQLEQIDVHRGLVGPDAAHRAGLEAGVEHVAKVEAHRAGHLAAPGLLAGKL